MFKASIGMIEQLSLYHLTPYCGPGFLDLFETNMALRPCAPKKNALCKARKRTLLCFFVTMLMLVCFCF